MNVFDKSHLVAYREFIIVGLFIIGVSVSQAQQLAFPGAEGFGRFTTGGRGGQVMEVTNLNDSGLGSLRNAVDTYGTRTVVFRVSGTIDLKSNLEIEYGNITIAGQTAPGGGICVKGYPVTVSADNVIIRYMRFRLGDENKVEADALSGQGNRNVIIDHCSMSWSVDEVSSFYDNENFTMQWCILSESLHNSCHQKGAHGYGGIWGGIGATFHHNLFAHHTSRNPRFQGNRGNSTSENEVVDHRNNVIYNWGGNSAYGGESGNHNMVANYYKSGPATRSGAIRYRIVEPSHDDQYGPYGQWYVQDNYVVGYPDVTSDNWNGGVQGTFWQKITRLNEPMPHAPVLTHTAEGAYQLALLHGGAVLPERDSVDERIIEEVRTGTATYGGQWGAQSGIIDSQNEVGGWPELASGVAPADEDHDGMADNWELGQGLNPADPDDRNDDLNGDGYTNLENYINGLCIRDDFILPVVDFTATAVSPTQIDLTWQENSLAETGFSIERSESDTSHFTEITTVGAGVTSYTDNGVVPATRYYYRVRAFRDQVYSLYSQTVTDMTNYADGRPLEASDPVPAHQATDVDVIQILQWKPGTAANSHDVYFGASTPPDFQGNQTGTTFDPRGLADETTYYWRIDEVNVFGTTPGSVWQFTTEAFTGTLGAHWPFNRAFGFLAIDATGNRNNGFLTNMLPSNWIDGIAGKALDFDGIDDYLWVEHDALIDVHIRGFTLSFWLRQSDDDLNTPWISKGIDSSQNIQAGYEIGNEGDHVVFRVADSDVESSLDFPNTDFITGDWVFVTAVRDRTEGQLLLYVNGILKAGVVDSTLNISQEANLFFGTTGEMQNFHKGALDDIRLYNYALLQEEIDVLYQSYLTHVSNSGLPEHYKTSLKNYPNPFNPTTTIAYTVARNDRVTLTVFNLRGQEVATIVDEMKKAGNYALNFDGSFLSSGIYMCHLNVGNEVRTTKLILTK